MGYKKAAKISIIKSILCWLMPSKLIQQPISQLGRKIRLYAPPQNEILATRVFVMLM